MSDIRGNYAFGEVNVRRIDHSERKRSLFAEAYYIWRPHLYVYNYLIARKCLLF